MKKFIAFAATFVAGVASGYGLRVIAEKRAAKKALQELTTTTEETTEEKK